ncbi:MAG: carboxypeptidase-like regulatory domain-containing protein [Flavobacteriaceae bacterium]|nr:carboxypeptidase-like regulatory domain-containing protein [Flavobacteriaceae bacterium]
MKKAITITVPEPCHENWDQMTPTEKGRFCGVCTKEVIDFSKSSDEELIKKIGSGQSLCGRFSTTQLNRKLTLERKSQNSLLPYAASLLLPLSLLSGLDTLAQGGPNVSESHYTSLGIGSNPTDRIRVTITGFITNMQGVPVSNAKIVVEETGETVLSNIDGSYRIVCISGFTLTYEAENMQKQKITIGTAHAQLNIALENLPVISILGGMVGIVVEHEEAIKKNTLSCSSADEIEVLKTKGKFISQETPVIEEQEKGKKLISINGTITDENNLPLPGVNVMIKGTTHETQTNFDGNYSINSESNQTLLFQYLGYETKEVLLSNISNSIDIKMEAMVEGFVVMTTGGYQINEDDTPSVNNPFNYQSPQYDPKQEERIEKRRKAAANELAFQKIKLERKKAAKAAKNRKRKRK